MFCIDCQAVVTTCLGFTCRGIYHGMVSFRPRLPFSKSHMFYDTLECWVGKLPITKEDFGSLPYLYLDISISLITCNCKKNRTYYVSNLITYYVSFLCNLHNRYITKNDIVFLPQIDKIYDNVIYLYLCTYNVL